MECMIKMNNMRASFTAASVLPVKVMQNHELIKKIRDEGKIIPLHVQLNPTNHCNLNCPFCSCSERDKKLELNYDEIMTVMTKAKKLGCIAVTITGGGEPLMHPMIKEIIEEIYKLGIKIGLVTNGLLLNLLSNGDFARITWCRISSSDYRPLTKSYKKVLESAVHKGRHVDWAFSHVVSNEVNMNVIQGIIEFANEHHFTHVRLVSDLLDLENVVSMGYIKNELVRRGVDDHLVIYQGRKEYVKGHKDCYISLLKPVVAADGYIYPCCGTQYALETPSLDYEYTMHMCKAVDIDKLYEGQNYFNGEICDRCYYSDYNRLLGILLSDVKHLEFV